MDKILVTGANGFVGYHLVKQLLDEGYPVIATGKGDCRLPFEGELFTYFTLDFTNEEQVKKVFHAHQPTVVVHLGAMSKPDECEQNKRNAFHVNVSGTVNLLEQAKQINAFFIFLSTDFVFDGIRGMYKEEDETSPVNYYGETKVLAELEVKNFAFDWAIVRTVLVYGETFSGRENIVSTVAKSLKKGNVLKMFDDQVRTPTYVEDLATGIISIIKKHATGIYHISGKDILTPYGIAVKVVDYLGYDQKQIVPTLERDFKEPARRPKKTGLDISKAIHDLGYKPVSFEEGLKKTFGQ